MPILKALATAALMLAVSGTSFVLAQEKSQPAPAATPPAGNGTVAPAPAQSSERDLRVQLKTLEEWDTTVDSLVNLTALVYNAQGSQDLGGHAIDYYWQRYIMTPATRESLDTLRDKAQKQSISKDTAGLQQTLNQASAILTAERVKAFDVSMFFEAQAPIIYHQYQLGPWLARATDADRQAINDRVGATYDKLAKQLEEVMKLPQPESPGDTVTRFFQVIVEPAAFFNSERARLVKAQANLPNPIAVSRRTRDNVPCPPPVPPVKGHDKPSIGADFPSSEAFYPPRAKLNNVEGSVILRAEISSSGCIQMAEVVGTSGAAELDEGALRLAMAGKYVPGEAGDKPTPGMLTFRVRFEQPEGALSSSR